jgi:hypothetical protein
VLLTKYYLGGQFEDVMGGNVFCMGRRGNAWRVFMAKSEVKRHLDDVGIVGKVQ